MSDKNFPAQHVRQGAEGADGNLLSLQISPSLNLRSDDKTMQKKLFTDIDYFSLYVAHHNGVESARRVSKLKRIGKKSHTTKVASRGDDFDVQLLLSIVTVLLRDDERHNSHRIIRHANFELPCLRLDNIGTQEQKDHRQCQCQNIGSRHVYIPFDQRRSIGTSPNAQRCNQPPTTVTTLRPSKHKSLKVEAVKPRLGLPFGSLYFRFCLFSQA